MNQGPLNIEVIDLFKLLIPLGVVAWVFVSVGSSVKVLSYAASRMVLQLVSIGFVLNFLFAAKNWILVTLVLAFMLMVAAWISLRPLVARKTDIYLKALLALSVGCLPVLLFVLIFVLHIDPWYEPSYSITLAGMVFSNSMNSLSLAAERSQVTLEKSEASVDYKVIFDASLIPIINSFFAVGLVALPGMMTGQILSGVHPMVAIRYQIVVMVMVLVASCLSSYVYLRTNARS
jgi:putative ABC transport system permease protein